jgi:hypothetical protein
MSLYPVDRDEPKWVIIHGSQESAREDEEKSEDALSTAEDPDNTEVSAARCMGTNLIGDAAFLHGRSDVDEQDDGAALGDPE